MSNNAIINFLFNSQGAVNQLNTFKKRFSNAVSSIENSSIGKLSRLGASLAGVFSVKGIMEHASQIGDLQQKYKNLMSLADVSKFSNMYNLLGGKDEEAMSNLEKAQQMVQDLIKGKASNNLVLLNISPIDKETGKIKSAVKFIEELRERLKTYSPSQRTDFLKEFGLDSAAMQRYINLNEEELKKYKQTAEKMGVVSRETVDRINQWNYSTAQLKISFYRLGETLLKLGIGDLVDKITAALNKFSEMPEGIQQSILGLILALTMIRPLAGIARIITSIGLALSSFTLLVAAPLIKTTASAILLLSKSLLKLMFALAGPLIKTAASAILLLSKSLLRLMFAFAVPLAGAAFIAFILAVIFNLGGLRDKLDETLKSYNEWVKEYSKEHPLKGSFLKQLGELAEDVLHPLEKLKEAYNDLADVFGWEKIGIDSDKGKKNKNKNKTKTKTSSLVATDITKINVNRLGVSQGVVSSQVKDVLKSNQDNRKFDFNFEANFYGDDIEKTSPMVIQYLREEALSVFEKKVKDTSINYGGIYK